MRLAMQLTSNYVLYSNDCIVLMYLYLSPKQSDSGVPDASEIQNSYCVLEADDKDKDFEESETVSIYFYLSATFSSRTTQDIGSLIRPYSTPLSSVHHKHFMHPVVSAPYLST